MYRSQKQQLRHLSKSEYKTIKELCFLNKNMYNVALYNVRQHYFNENQYLRYESNYHVCKSNENYQLLNTDIAQQTIKVIDRTFKSFFALIKKAKSGSYQFNKVALPKYLNKEGLFPLIMPRIKFKDGYFDIPMSPAFKRLYGKVSIKVPQNILNKKVKEIRLLPKHNGQFFELEYIYIQEKESVELDKTKYLSIDFGLENLCTCVTTEADSFIIDGKKMKSINQFYNKQNSNLQSIKDKQKNKKITKKQYLITQKRNNQVNDYLNKTTRYIINYCLKNTIGTIVVGYNIDFKRNINIGRKNNQNFTQIPIGKLREKLQSLCERYNISYIEQEESYTSKSDFLGNDILPIYNADNPKTYKFKGKRISRGQYKSSTGIILNADINGALNIMKKTNIIDMTVLMSKKIKQPQRIRIA